MSPHRMAMFLLAALAIGLALYGTATENSHRSMLGAWLNSCDIRGNISRHTGERIYHVPGQTYYNATMIGDAGERWFCSEVEAQQAGWRRAKM